MEKMLGDTLEKVMDDPEDMEEAAQFEIDNVCFKINKLKSYKFNIKSSTIIFSGVMGDHSWCARSSANGSD